MPVVISVLFVTAICITQSTSSANPAILSQLNDNHISYHNCSWTIIKVFATKDLTLVNVKNDKFLRNVFSLQVKVITRKYLATKLEKPNQAYVLHCNNLEECETGFEDLVKDRYWNPKAIFFIAAKKYSRDYESFYWKLHRLYVFKTVLVLHDRVYIYDFQIAEHCRFTVNAIREYKCDSLSSNHDALIWADIKGYLEERVKTPYSACNISVVGTVIKPFVFPPLYLNQEPVGYEEEFFQILLRMNFTNIMFSYNLNLSNNGVVCENFTVSGLLRTVQTGAIDYILGGTLLSNYRLQVFDFTYPHWCDDFVLIVPKAKQIDKWEVMYTVFKPLVWGLILLALVCVSLVAFILQFNHKKRFSFHPLVLTVLNLYGYFTNNASKYKTISFFLLSWALFAWLITCFYQSDLASIFTRPTYYKQINSLPELISHKYKLFLSKGKYDYMKVSKDLDMGGLVHSSVICRSDRECLKAVAYERKLYTVVSRLSYLYFESEFHKNGGETMLHEVVEPYIHVFRTGYLRKGNPNLQRIRFLERQVIAFGFHQRSLLAHIHMKKLKYYKKRKNLSEPLSWHNIAGVYYVYLCGCGISFVAFILEIVPIQKIISLGR